MSAIGTRLTLLIGPTVPLPAPKPILGALDSVEVTHSDEGRSGFQLIFKLKRSSASFLDYALLANPLLKPSRRVIVIVTVGALPRVLMDGIITNQQLDPGSEETSLTLTGEDVSVMMDLEEKTVEHPAQPEAAIVAKLIASYAQYGLIPLVIPPPLLDIPLPTERTPVQRGTDLAYLREMAERFDFVFYVLPGPEPATNTAYWGPLVRVGVPQPALTVDMGAETNVVSINFNAEPLQATRVSGRIQDRTTNQQIPIQTFVSLRPPLAVESALANAEFVRKSELEVASGLNAAQAQTRAQAETDASTDVVKVEGELNAARYGTVLQARGLVGLRGVGWSYDGLYYVQKVTHSIRKGEYKQKFTLTREGLGSTVPVVVP